MLPHFIAGACGPFPSGGRLRATAASANPMPSPHRWETFLASREARDLKVCRRIQSVTDVRACWVCQLMTPDEVLYNDDVVVDYGGNGDDDDGAGGRDDDSR